MHPQITASLSEALIKDRRGLADNFNRRERSEPRALTNRVAYLLAAAVRR